MIELSWNRNTEPAKMLAFLRESGRLSERKARLFAVACCRHIWPLLADARSRTAVEVAERYADSIAGDRERYAARSAAAQAASEAKRAIAGAGRGGVLALDRMPAWRAAGAATHAVSSAWQFLDAVDWASLAAGEEPTGDKRTRAGYAEQDYQAALLRHFVNPFRLPKSVSHRWRTDAVLFHATQAYEHRVYPAGHLDPARVNGLFDVIVNAGCREIDLLDHLGGAEPHPPGCWAIDLVLNKE